MPVQMLLKEKQREDEFIICLKTHQQRKAEPREGCDLSYSDFWPQELGGGVKRA